MTALLVGAIVYLIAARDRGQRSDEPATVPHYLADGLIHLHHTYDMNGSRQERIHILRPYSVRVGDQIQRGQPSADGGSFWAIELDGGRVWVFAEPVKDTPQPAR